MCVLFILLRRTKPPLCRAGKGTKCENATKKKINKKKCRAFMSSKLVFIQTAVALFYFIVIGRGGEMKSEESKKVWQPHFGATKVRHR